MRTNETDAVWKALADPTRRTLLELLRGGPLSTTELCEPFPHSRIAMLKHLGALEDAGLVTSSKDGRARVYELRTHRLEQIHEDWLLPFLEHPAPTSTTR